MIKAIWTASYPQFHNNSGPLRVASSLQNSWTSNIYRTKRKKVERVHTYIWFSVISNKKSYKQKHTFFVPRWRRLFTFCRIRRSFEIKRYVIRYAFEWPKRTTNLYGINFPSGFKDFLIFICIHNTLILNYKIEHLTLWCERKKLSLTYC
jgi:hypothetical protein